MNGFHLLILVGLVLIGVDIWDRRRRERLFTDAVDVAGLSVYRHQVHRVDRRVHPDGRRDLVVFVNSGQAWFDLAGEDACVFLDWWEARQDGDHQG